MTAAVGSPSIDSKRDRLRPPPEQPSAEADVRRSESHSTSDMPVTQDPYDPWGTRPAAASLEILWPLAALSVRTRHLRLAVLPSLARKWDALDHRFLVIPGAKSAPRKTACWCDCPGVGLPRPKRWASLRATKAEEAAMADLPAARGQPMAATACARSADASSKSSTTSSAAPRAAAPTSSTKRVHETRGELSAKASSERRRITFARVVHSAHPATTPRRAKIVGALAAPISKWRGPL